MGRLGAIERRQARAGPVQRPLLAHHVPRAVVHRRRWQHYWTIGETARCRWAERMYSTSGGQRSSLQVCVGAAGGGL